MINFVNRAKRIFFLFKGYNAAKIMHLETRFIYASSFLNEVPINPKSIREEVRKNFIKKT
jgi:hypothetical protein